jgi:hypothetical protein
MRFLEVQKLDPEALGFRDCEALLEIQLPDLEARRSSPCNADRTSR